MHGRRPGVVTLLLLLAVLVVLLSAFWWPDSGRETTNGPRSAWALAEKRLALRLADDVLLASQALASERGLALAALGALDPIAAAEASTVVERRRDADAAVARVEAFLKRIQPSPTDQHLKRVAAAQAMVVSQRQEFDRDAGKPAHLRSIHTGARSFEVSTALIAAMQDLLGTIHTELKAADNAITGWLEVQRLSLEMAEYAGRERAQIGIFLAASGRAARRQLTSADYNRHRAVSVWQQMQSTLAGLAPQPRLTEQTRLVQQTYFADCARLRGLLLTAAQSQAAQPMTAPEWFGQATLAIEAMIEFGRKAGALAAENLSRTA
jgi:hypothetical protein